MEGGVPFKSGESEQFFREEVTDDAVYNVCLKKVQYNTSTDDNFVGEKKARLQWRLEECRVIKCGTLEKLVEAMCFPSGELDSTFVDTLLGTYRTFASPKELMEAISKRFAELGDPLSQNVRESCRRSLKTVLVVWLDSYPEDFREQPTYPALCLLEKFARENFPESDLSDKVQQKRNLFQEQEDGPDSVYGPVEDLAITFRCSILDSIGNTYSAASRLLPFPLDMLSIPSRIFAEQLTYMDAELFRKVVPFHCLGSVWSRRSDKKQLIQPVTVFATVDHFNAVSHRVIATTLKWPYLNAADRALVIEKWIDIAQECRALKNFSSLKAIISGLQSTSVFRLKSIWQFVPRDKSNLFKELANIFNEDNNHSLWRELLIKEGTAKFVEPEAMNTLRGTMRKKSLSEAAKAVAASDLANQTSTMQGTVPYLGTFLTDLTMVDTAFKDFVRDELVNFEKKRKEFELMAQIQMLQSSASLYRIEPDFEFFRWFYGIRIYDGNESFELSYEIEPKDVFQTVNRRSHRKNASIGYFATRRPASMEDLNFFRDSVYGVSNKQDEDSRSISSLQETLASQKLPHFRHSISMCSTKSGVSMLSIPQTVAVDQDGSVIAKVFLCCSENHHTNNYKSILLNNNDHAQTVLRNVLLKYNVLSRPEDYVLFQQLSNNSEMSLPDRGNIFYAIKKDVGDVKFVVRKRTDVDRQKLKKSRTKNRFSKLIMNV